METKAKFNVILSSEASDFLEGLNSKIREKIIYNIRKSTYTIDPELFKKLDDTNIWKFRTRYNNAQYRLLAFWDKTSNIDCNTRIYQKNSKDSIKRNNKSPRNKKRIFQL